MNLGDYIDKHEGRVAVVYDDATGKAIRPGSKVVGHPTIGPGIALDVAPLTEAEMDYLRDNRIALAQTHLIRLFGKTFTGASDARQAALIDMRYTLGAGGFLAFHDLMSAVNRGDWKAAAAAALDSAWARSQAPARAAQDAAMLGSGEWPTT